jgi:hypothetical protein
VKSRRRLALGAVVLIAGGVAFGATRLQARVERTSAVPTVRVRRGRSPDPHPQHVGELRSARSTMLMGRPWGAPSRSSPSSPRARW